MRRQIVISPAVLVLGIGLVLALMTIAAMATLMLASDESASPPARAQPSQLPRSPSTLATVPSRASATVETTEMIPSATATPTATPIPPTPTVVAIAVRPTPPQPTLPPTPVPPTEAPGCVARVVAASYPPGMIGTVKVINDLTGKVTAFPDLGYSSWFVGACAAKQGNCAARVIGYVRFPGGSLNGTTTVVSEVSGEVSSFVVTSHGGWLHSACITR